MYVLVNVFKSALYLLEVVNGAMQPVCCSALLVALVCGCDLLDGGWLLGEVAGVQVWLDVVISGFHVSTFWGWVVARCWPCGWRELRHVTLQCRVETVCTGGAPSRRPRNCLRGWCFRDTAAFCWSVCLGLSGRTNGSREAGMLCAGLQEVLDGGCVRSNRSRHGRGKWLML
eukprot:2549719-Amphidinium_carterae.2